MHRIRMFELARPRFWSWLILTLLFLIVTNLAQAQTGTLTFTVTTQRTGQQITPTLTWATTPAAASCSATGDAAWTGTKAASGTQTLALVAPPRTYTLRCVWPGEDRALVSWARPTTNTDGTPLTDLAGYRVQWGTSPSNLSESRYIESPTTLSTTITGLAVGSWSFGVRAYNAQGLESDLSNVVSKTITAPFEVTHTVGIKVPGAPTGLTIE